MASHCASKEPPTHGRTAGVSTWTKLTKSSGCPGATHLLWARTADTRRVWRPGSWAVPPTSSMLLSSFPRRLMLLWSRKLVITSSGKVSPDLASKRTSPHMKPLSRRDWILPLDPEAETEAVFSRCSSALKSWATQADCSFALSAAQELTTSETSWDADTVDWSRSRSIFSHVGSQGSSPDPTMGTAVWQRIAFFHRSHPCFSLSNVNH